MPGTILNSAPVLTHLASTTTMTQVKHSTVSSFIENEMETEKLRKLIISRQRELCQIF